MIGAIIGDIVGSRFEFNNHLNKEFDFFHPNCEFTDDTVMTCAGTQTLMDANHYMSMPAGSDGYSAVHQFEQSVDVIAVDLLRPFREGQRFIREDDLRLLRCVDKLRRQHTGKTADIDDPGGQQIRFQKAEVGHSGNPGITVAADIQPDHFTGVQINGEQIGKGAVAVNDEGSL